MIEIDNLDISYDGINYIRKGKMIIPEKNLIGIYGESGAGKTSFLNFLSLQNNMVKGEIIINGNRIDCLSLEERNQYRLNYISYLKQTTQFISGLSCYEVLKFSAQITNNDASEKNIKDILKQIDLDIDENVFPYQLSGGQRQLLAIGQALIKKSQIILCDEITSALDENMSFKIIDLLKKIVHEKSITVIMVTHNEKIKNNFDLLLSFENKTINTLPYTEKKVEKLKVSKTNTNKFSYNLLNKAYLKSTRKSKVLFCCLIILGVSIISVGYKYGFQITNHIKNLQSMVEKNMYYVINHTTNVNDFAYLYTTYNIHFDKDSMNDILNIDGIEEVYPLVIFHQQERYLNVYGDIIENENCFYYKINNNSESIFLENRRSPTVLPFLNQNYMDYQCDSAINDNGSIYITRNLADSLGIVDVIDRPVLSYTALVPIDLQEEDIVIDGQTVKSEEPIYVEKKFEYEIRGILNIYYPHLTGTDNIYMKYDEMVSIIDNEEKKYQTLWEPNTLIVYTSAQVDSQKLSASLKNINSNYNVIDKSENIAEVFLNIQKPEEMIRTYLIVMIIIVILMSVVYSYMQYRNDYEFFVPIVNEGVNYKKLSISLLYNILKQTTLIVISALLVTNLLYRLGVNFHILIEVSNTYQDWLMVNLICFVLSVLVVILSYIISIIKLIILKQYD